MWEVFQRRVWDAATLLWDGHSLDEEEMAMRMRLMSFAYELLEPEMRSAAVLYAKGLGFVQTGE